LWQTILRTKYLTRQTIGVVERRPGDSHFWAGLIKAKANFLIQGSFRLNNGKQIRFWEDKWLGNYSFQEQYPSLYNIVRRKSATVESVLSTIPLNVSFRRFLSQNNLELWHNLIGRIMDVEMNDLNDVFIWNINTVNIQFGLYI
jgi:hypothetical protein